MSAGHEEPEEPDLTALLDLVLQLVMFFLAVARIDNEQRQEQVKLPEAAIARSLTRDYNKIVILNLFRAPPPPDKPPADENSPVTKVRYSLFEGFGTNEYPELIEIKNALKDKFEADKKATSEADWAAGKGRSLIVIRAHRMCSFKQVHDVMMAAREAGFSDVQLRAFRAVQ